METINELRATVRDSVVYLPGDTVPALPVMERKHIYSVSFGKDSLAMLLMAIDKGLPIDEVVFFNIGVEFDAIYSVRDMILPILAERGIKYTELEIDKPFYWYMFEKPVCKKGTKIVHKYGYDRGIYWEQNGVRLYEILDRVSCRICRNKNLKELQNIKRYLPETWTELMELQNRIPQPFKPGRKNKKTGELIPGKTIHYFSELWDD